MDVAFLVICILDCSNSVQNAYRECVRPDSAAASRLLAMADGVSIVLDYAERSVAPRALWGGRSAGHSLTADSAVSSRNTVTEGERQQVCAHRYMTDIYHRG